MLIKVFSVLSMHASKAEQASSRGVLEGGGGGNRLAKKEGGATGFLV